MKAPFPWFGGKSRVAYLVWERFGNVPNYVEPFFGSGAVLLGRPTPARTETVNDIDCYLANFWRAVATDPEAVAHHADWPINEADLHARHLWLVNQVEFRERMKADPEFFDVKVAGWWVWGICQWIGSGWCSRPEWTGRGNASRAPRGIAALEAKRPQLKRGGLGVHRKMPLIGERGQGRGVLSTIPRQLPNLSGDGGATGRGIHASAKSETPTAGWFFALQDRLRRVRVCCGEWDRILGPSPTVKIGVTGVFLDPPYGDVGRDEVYSHDSLTVAAKVREWALANGDNKDLRIALCGYEGEHEMPGWECVEWKSPGGYGNQGKGRGRDNAKRERIWFSPHCLSGKQKALFGGGS